MTNKRLGLSMFCCSMSSPHLSSTRDPCDLKVAGRRQKQPNILPCIGGLIGGQLPHACSKEACYKRTARRNQADDSSRSLRVIPDSLPFVLSFDPSVDVWSDDDEDD